MKIKKSQLRRIIREEKAKLLSEAGYGFTYGRQADGVSYAVGDIIRFKVRTGGLRKVKVTGRTHVDHINWNKLTDEQYSALNSEREELYKKGIDYDVEGIKNNRPGFIGNFLDGEGEDMWGYDTQVEYVER